MARGLSQEVEMNLRNRTTLLILTLLWTSVLLIGCGRSTVKVGWIGSSGPGYTGYRYITFDGLERATFRAEAGQNISLDYDFAVEKGTLTLEIVAPDGESLWERTYHEDADESVTLTAPQKGRYQVRLEGEATGGSFDLSWSVGE